MYSENRLKCEFSSLLISFLDYIHHKHKIVWIKTCTELIWLINGTAELDNLFILLNLDVLVEHVLNFTRIPKMQKFLSCDKQFRIYNHEYHPVCHRIHHSHKYSCIVLLTDWLVDWLLGWLVDWLIGWLDCLFDLSIHKINQTFLKWFETNLNIIQCTSHFLWQTISAWIWIDWLVYWLIDFDLVDWKNWLMWSFN